MSQMQPTLIKSFKAASDLSAKQYYFVRLTGEYTVDVGNATTRPVGVLYETNTADKTVGVIVSGTAKVIAGGAISAGALIVCNASGKAIARTTEDPELIIGQALESAAAADQIIEIKLF